MGYSKIGRARARLGAGNRKRAGTAAALHVRASAIALTAASGGMMATTIPALAACVVSGSTLTCDGDLSGGVNQSSATLTTVVIGDLTANIGANGVSFQNTGALDISATADLGSYVIATVPGSSREARNGFHLIGNGAINATLIGNVTGRSGQDESIFGDGLIHGHYAFVGLQANGDIDFDFTGDVIVQTPNLTIESDFVAAANTRRFAALRAEAGGGDITIVHTGDIQLTGGNLTAISTDTTGSNRALITALTANSQFETYGFFARSEGALDFDNTGIISVLGGTSTATASSLGGRAEALADTGRTGGIVLDPRESSQFAAPVPPGRFDSVMIDQTGDVTVVVGDSIALAQSTTTGATPSQAAARAGNLSDFHTGIRLLDGFDVTLAVNGDVTITSGVSRATADALLAGDSAPGLIYIRAYGADVAGIEARAAFISGQVSTIGNLTIDGNVTAIGGDAEGIARASGAGREIESGAFPPTGTTPSSMPIIVTGGGGGAIAVSQFNDLSLAINGEIRAGGGDARAEIEGANLNAYVQGGNAVGISAGGTGSPVRLTLGPDTVIFANGGDASADHDGTGFRTSVVGGRATGMFHNFAFTGDFENTVAITVTGGDASISGTGAFGSGAVGGEALGLRVNSSAFPGVNMDTPTGTYTNSAAINVSGGNASTTAADVAATGGRATGILVVNVLDFVSLGPVTVRGGTGDSRDGAVFGIATDGFYFPGVESPDTPLFNVRVGGDVTVEGLGYAIEDFPVWDFNLPGFSFNVTDTLSGGVVTYNNGLNTTEIDGASVDASGDNVHGIVAASEFNRVIIRAGSTVTTDGLGASGIEVRPYSDVVSAFDPAAITGTTAGILVEYGATVHSMQGVGINDEDRAVILVNSSGTTYVPQIISAPNATTADIAGTVIGGGGVAINLGTGADMLTLRSTAQITGAVTLGAGNDRFAFEEGFTVSGTVDGGDGDDAVVADVGEGDTRTLDVGAQPIVNFEVIEKLGAGALVLNGADLPTPYRLDALGGLTTIGRNFDNLSAVIGAGARVHSNFVLGDVTIRTDGLFTGDATVGDLIVDGTVAPGNSIGKIVVLGDATFNAGSTYEIEIEAPDQADLIEVTGKAIITRPTPSSRPMAAWSAMATSRATSRCRCCARTWSMARTTPARTMSLWC